MKNVYDKPQHCQSLFDNRINRHFTKKL